MFLVELSAMLSAYWSSKYYFHDESQVSRFNEKNGMREDCARAFASLLIGKRTRSLCPHYFILFIKDSCTSD